jgi:hypothetical protein
MAAPLDLTGRWDGTYRYSDNLGPETPFVAVFSETGARFSGEIIEPNEFRPMTARALVEGIRSGKAIDFIKTYLSAGPAYNTPVDYSGHLSDDGQSISGTWFLEELYGTFEMHREVSWASPEEVSVVEHAPLTR